MKDYDESMKVNHKSDWSYITCHSYRILIVGQSG